MKRGVVATAWAYVDLFGVLIAILAVAIAFMVVRQDDTETADPLSLSSLIITVVWPDARNADVDLWISGPDNQPVGYSKKHSRYINLLRDDLGHIGDSSGLNFEVALTHGIPAGEYTVNLHVYNDAEKPAPVPVHVSAQIRAPEDSHMLWEEDVAVVYGEEVTVRRFTIDADGRMLSSTYVPRMLRSSPP